MRWTEYGAQLSLHTGEHPLPARKKQRPKRRPFPPNAILSARLHKALSHPLRVQILRVLSSKGSASATELSDLLAEPLGDVAYHMKALRTEPRLIELTKRRQVRGAQEKFYRLSPNSTVAKIGWPPIPESARQGLRGTAFAEFMTSAISALRAGTVDAREGSTFASWPLRLDSQGWDEVRAAVVEATEKINRAEEKSCERLGKASAAGEVRAIIGTYVFEPAEPQDTPA